MKKASRLCYSNWQPTHPPVHDGHIAVIGHHSEQDGLSTSEEMFPKDLHHASIEEDGIPFTEGIDDQFRVFTEE